MNWYVTVLQKYAVFTGRARRKEYWMWVLFNLIISIILNIIDFVADLHIGANLGILSFIYGLAVLIPSIAVIVRRLHDTNRTGWWIFIVLIPFVGAIILIVFAALDSSPGDNRYGPNPKAGNPPAPLTGATP
jgi:uncharacterized membrane protein YhaH (DUF805 family)